MTKNQPSLPNQRALGHCQLLVRLATLLSIGKTHQDMG
jgi:hypothetical protein